MGKSSRVNTATAGRRDLSMQVLGSSGAREQIRFERATREAVQVLVRLGTPPNELAASICRCLNKMHGPEWHCLVGKVKAFSVHVRYWRGKSFLFEDNGLRIIVFQSAPPSPTALLPTSPPLAKGAEAERPPTSFPAERMSIKVLRSEMEQQYQKWILATAAASASELGKVGGDLDTVVAAIKVALTESLGPVWHVVATRGQGNWSFHVAFEEGRLIDFKLNGDRFLCWKHAQAPPRLMDMLTTKRISWFLFVVTVLLLCAYVTLQASCDRCCSSRPGVRETAECASGPSSSGGEVVDLMGGCQEDVTLAADLCLRNSKTLLLVTCGTLAAATALKWSDRSKLKRPPGHRVA